MDMSILLFVFLECVYEGTAGALGGYRLMFEQESGCGFVDRDGVEIEIDGKGCNSCVFVFQCLDSWYGDLSEGA